jgi:hypothetical protein
MQSFEYSGSRIVIAERAVVCALRVSQLPEAQWDNSKDNQYEKRDHHSASVHFSAPEMGLGRRFPAWRATIHEETPAGNSPLGDRTLFTMNKQSPVKWP